MSLGYERWVKRLKKARMILQYEQAVTWHEILKGAKRYLVTLPDHERNISVVNHYLNVVARQNPQVNLSLVVPPRFTHLFSNNPVFAQIFEYPELRNKTRFPINEEQVSHIPRIFDVALDLNHTPYILSHYITATRATRLSAGFYNSYSSELFVHSVQIHSDSDYEKGVKSLLKMGGLLNF